MPDDGREAGAPETWLKPVKYFTFFQNPAPYTVDLEKSNPPCLPFQADRAAAFSCRRAAVGDHDDRLVPGI